MTKKQILEVLNASLCDHEDESGRYFREDTIAELFSAIPVVPTDDEIEKEFPCFHDGMFHRKNTPNELNICKQEGATWLRDRIPSAPDKRDESEPLSLEEALHEREALFQAFDKIRGCFKGRHWLMEGRGCYPWDDERYKEEVRYIMDEFDQINKDLWKQIKSKSFEYREKIKAPLNDLIQKQDELNKLRKDYSDFLGEQLGGNAIFLANHGILCSEEDVKVGKEYRNQINQLESEIKKLKQ